MDSENKGNDAGPISNPPPVERSVDPLFLAEFFLWTMVALAPIMTWANGPAVSTDQFVGRTAVFSLALAGGIGLRAWKIVHRKRE
jgi:hypothetical protein